jgi:hypothetical protein
MSPDNRNDRGKVKLLIGILVLLAVIVAGVIWVVWSNGRPASPPVAVTHPEPAMPVVMPQPQPAPGKTPDLQQTQGLAAARSAPPASGNETASTADSESAPQEKASQDDDDSRILRNLNKQVAKAQAQLQLVSIQKQLGEYDGSASSGVPELAGLFTGPGGGYAQFLRGQNLITARPGDWVTSEWKLTRIDQSGVVLTNRSHHDTLRLAVGSVRSVPTATGPAPSFRQTPPGQGVRQ